jgi:hypothetical protein
LTQKPMASDESSGKDYFSGETHPKKRKEKKNCSRVVPVLFAQTERFPRNSSDCWNFYRIATKKTAGSKSNIRAENAEMARRERKEKKV